MGSRHSVLGAGDQRDRASQVGSYCHFFFLFSFVWVISSSLVVGAAGVVCGKRIYGRLGSCQELADIQYRRRHRARRRGEMLNLHNLRSSSNTPESSRRSDSTGPTYVALTRAHARPRHPPLVCQGAFRMILFHSRPIGGSHVTDKKCAQFALAIPNSRNWPSKA